MSLVDIMIEQMASARHVLENHDDEYIVPSWIIVSPTGEYLIHTRFDQNEPEQRERALLLISRFMTWKMATSFVLTVETGLGAEETREGEEAILVIGVSRQERLGLVQRIEERDPLRLGPPEWLQADQIDETYFDLLPGKTSEITVDEIAELTAIFGDGGEMAAERLS
jgi:hypothetical protein